MGVYSTHCICSCKFTTITEWQRLVDKMAVWPVCPRPPPSLAQRVPHPHVSWFRECPTHLAPGSESVPPTCFLAQRVSRTHLFPCSVCAPPTCFLAQRVPLPPVSWLREWPFHTLLISEGALSSVQST